ncbi:MAG: GAF domain-containing protein, partial [Anaerolineales bacterium]
EIPLLALAQQKKGISVHLYGSVIGGLFAVLVTLFWQGIEFIAILISLIPAAMALRHGMPRKYLPVFFLILVVTLIGIVYLSANPAVERLNSNSPSAIASIVFLVATSLLLVTITMISQNRRFRSLQGLLLASFVIIVMIPTVMTAILSAIGAYTYNQTQTYSALETITILKRNQIENLVEDSQNDTGRLLTDQRFTTNVIGILTGTDLNPILEQNFKQVARTRAVDVLGGEEEAYSEMMVLDTQGTVVISTIPENEGISYQKQPFFKQGISKFYTGFAEEPSFGAESLIVAAPIFDAREQATRGILVLRSSPAVLKNIAENTSGFSAAETYFVNAHFRPVSRTRTPVEMISSKAALEAIDNQVVGEKAIYANYAGQQVLGYYEWFEPMELAIIAEVPVSVVVNNSIRSLAGSAILALLVVAVAIVAVVISARTIADPIQTLAQTTESFAAGKLTARAIVDREDEIGALAQAYNQMAAQLQEMIGRLEQRVADRTRDLESQTLRIRVAAEIARDAASAHDLQELLARTAELICTRFGFYHAGIFLLDNPKEYAVLVASPTEAGQKMMQNHHRLRVGETGIVGRVAATGEPRVTLNTGADAVYFNNPFLPNTRSEMSLPLKVENLVIGVLDVQSDQAQAFGEDDVAIMQVLADQLATAIERTRLLQEVEKNLKELESAYGRFTSENWKDLSVGKLTANKGYRFDNVRIEPITELPELAGTVLKTGTTAGTNGSRPGIDKEQKVAIPIKLRGQTIGVISLKLKEGYDTNTISVIELAAERLASAMESARLYEEARLRADREQSISRITTAISGSTEYDEILQTTVREIGNILSDTEVTIQIVDESAANKQAEEDGP